MISPISYLVPASIANANVDYVDHVEYVPTQLMSARAVSFLTGWLLEGVCRDPCDEFPVRQLPSAARATDETFWTSAFDHPSFLQVWQALGCRGNGAGC